MDSTNFATNFLGSWEESDRDIDLREIAVRYIQRTEDYDRSFCTGPIQSGAIQPATPYELGLVNRNALHELNLLCSRHAGQYSRRDILKAIQHYEPR